MIVTQFNCCERYCDGNIWVGSVTGKYKGHLGKRSTKRHKKGPARSRRDQEGPGGTTRDQERPEGTRRDQVGPRETGPRETRKTR